MNAQHYQPIFPGDYTLRSENMETITRYVTYTGPDRMRRWRLFADYILPSSGYRIDGQDRPPGDTLVPRRVVDEDAPDMFRDFRFVNPVIMQSHDPNRFLVQSDGFGHGFEDGTPGRFRSDRYYFSMLMEDGKIKRSTEYTNVCKGHFDKCGEFLDLPDLGPDPVMNALVYVEEDFPRRGFRADDAPERGLNRQIVEQYLHTTGPARAALWQCFTEDCITGPGFTADFRPMCSAGILSQQRLEERSHRISPDWRFRDVLVYQCDDPGYFAAEAEGEGQVTWGEKTFTRRDHFIFTFRMERGKIKVLRYYCNPVKRYADMGYPIAVPPEHLPPE